MSTKLTKNNVLMVESHALKLVLGAAQVHESIINYLAHSLQNIGYEVATPSILNFLSKLDCATANYASEIARDLGVSRQMVAKTVNQLCQAGYLIQIDGQGKQKEILFTKEGEQLIADARQLLSSIDKKLIKKIGGDAINNIVTDLELIQEVMTDLHNTR